MSSARVRGKIGLCCTGAWQCVAAPPPGLGLGRANAVAVQADGGQGDGQGDEAESANEDEGEVHGHARVSRCAHSAVSSAACLLSLPSEQPQRGGAMWGLARFLLLSFLAALSAGLCICFATQIASVYRALRALCCLCIKGEAGDAGHESGRPHRTATLAATPKGRDKAAAEEQVIEDAHAKRLIRSRSGGRLFSTRPQR